MAACSKCHNQDMEYKSGIAKATGKKWQGWKCTTCDIMHGMDGKPWGAKVATPKGNHVQMPQQNPMMSIEKKLDQILGILKANYPETEIQEEESSPF